MGAGPADPLRLPAASQVLAVPPTQRLIDIRRVSISTQDLRNTLKQGLEWKFSRSCINDYQNNIIPRFDFDTDASTGIKMSVI